jgi:hypothetical protein
METANLTVGVGHIKELHNENMMEMRARQTPSASVVTDMR